VERGLAAAAALAAFRTALAIIEQLAAQDFADGALGQAGDRTWVAL